MFDQLNISGFVEFWDAQLELLFTNQQLIDCFALPQGLKKRFMHVLIIQKINSVFDTP